jgi:hypothetical protein
MLSALIETQPPRFSLKVWPWGMHAKSKCPTFGKVYKRASACFEVSNEIENSIDFPFGLTLPHDVKRVRGKTMAKHINPTLILSGEVIKE